MSVIDRLMVNLNWPSGLINAPCAHYTGGTHGCHGRHVRVYGSGMVSVRYGMVRYRYSMARSGTGTVWPGPVWLSMARSGMAQYGQVWSMTGLVWPSMVNDWSSMAMSGMTRSGMARSGMAMSGYVWVQSGYVWVQSGYVWVQSGYVWVQA